MVDKITQTETELLSNALERILTSAVLIKDLGDTLPKTDILQDSNKVYAGKASMLFVDMRDSTKLPDQFDAERLIKIYRSYIRTIVQAVRYSNGVVRDFMGDGVLAVFIDDDKGKSEDKAVYAARYITTAIDKFLNPMLDETLRYRISCGIGIHTGEVTLSKVGMKGKEQDDKAESEYGIAWIGNSTNLACKQSGAVGGGTIFISTSTYAALSDLNKAKYWKHLEIEKGSNVLKGYIAEHFYLDLDEELEPCCACQQREAATFPEMLKKRIEEITEQAIKLGREEQAFAQKEKDLKSKELFLNKKEEQLNTKARSLDWLEYSFYSNVIKSGFCRKEYVLEMGMDFWEENLEKAISSGEKVGKNQQKVKQDLSYAMVSIYESLGIYDKAYMFLVEQARGFDWLSVYTTKDIVQKVGHCSLLEEAVVARIAKGDLLPQNKPEFEAIRDWLFYEYNIAPIG